MKRNVFLVCTGLGRINRGYESFTRECFDALKSNSDFELYLIKGGGKRNKKELRIPNLHRKGKIVQFLGKLLKQDPYVIEQFTFCISLLPLIVLKRPVVIYYSDFNLGTYLWHLRRILKFRYKLLFSNGAPNKGPYKTEDHVQQLLPFYHDNAIKNGELASKQTLLPYGFNIDVNERLRSVQDRERLRKLFGFTSEQKVIISVGAINMHHKRMDFVIKEVANLPENYFLLMLGQFEKETDDIISLAKSKLAGRHLIANVSHEKVMKYYIASDYFVLGSLNEGFGRVIIEALSYGLPCILHDYINAKQVLHQYGNYVNMENEGSLSAFLKEEKLKPNKTELIHAAYLNYSWDKLANRYIKMISNLSTK
jgi:1,2-diacylglycerol 3-alpha-glucosyltransferase